MVKANHKAALPKTKRFATNTADVYPPLGDAENPQHRLVPRLQLLRRGFKLIRKPESRSVRIGL